MDKKKQDRQSSGDKVSERQQERPAPDQAGNRRDEVGHSGVYPQSGPHPSDPNAPLRHQGSWGDGREQVAQGAGEGLGGGQSGSERSQMEGRQAGQSRSDRTQEPQGKNLDELYEENTEIRRETEFRDATAHPIDPDAGGPKVTPDNDLFRKEGE
jgi:hypothetical protein